MDCYNKYQKEQYSHIARTLVEGQYLAGWPPRKTIRSSESMRENIEIWSGGKYIIITIKVTIHSPNDVVSSPVDSSRNFEVIFKSNLTYSNHILLCLNPAYVTFKTSDVSQTPSIEPQRVP